MDHYIDWPKFYVKVLSNIIRRFPSNRLGAEGVSHTGDDLGVQASLQARIGEGVGAPEACAGALAGFGASCQHSGWKWWQTRFTKICSNASSTASIISDVVSVDLG